MRYLYLLLGCLILSSSLNASIFSTNMIGFSNYIEIDKKVYVENKFSKDEYKSLLALISKSKQRIIDSFGSFTSKPVIIISKSSKDAKKYAGNDYGSTIRLPWNEYVRIGPKGINIDVISHELLHAEVGYRLGYYITNFSLPVWVDEGIGMQVDYRKDYDIDLKLVKKEEINRVMKTGVSLFASKEESFWYGGKEQVTRNYAISKALISKILKENKSLYFLLSQIKDGKDINEVFKIKDE